MDIKRTFEGKPQETLAGNLEAWDTYTLAPGDQTVWVVLGEAEDNKLSVVPLGEAVTFGTAHTVAKDREVYRVKSVVQVTLPMNAK